MAIIIPSRHIYAKDNPKVITNQIGKVEVQSVKVAPDNHYDESVYNENFSSRNYITGMLQENNDLDYYVGVGTNPSSYANAYVSILPYYCTQTVTIPKIIDNKNIIKSIKSGIDKNGDTNIKYTTVCEVLIGTLSAKVLPLGGENEGKYNLLDLNVNYPDPQGDYKNVDIPKTLTETETFDRPQKYQEVTAELTLDDKTNLGTLSIQEDNDNYIFSCTLLCGAETYVMKGNGYLASGSGAGFFSSGTATKYIPYTVTITVYGNTIGIDLQDNTITIGSGTNVVSFSGNELMQDTNTPTIENTYQKVKTQYNNGKEVATLRCGIEDYYDKRPIDIDIVNSAIVGNVRSVTVSTEENLVVNDKIYLNNGTILTVIGKQGKYFFCETDISSPIIYDKQTAKLYIKVISTTSENKLPMTFHIGDIAIPYVFGANGKDKPMSLKVSGDAKEFKVIGKKMIYDGAVWQDITLQEYSAIKSNQVQLKLVRVVYEESVAKQIEAFVEYGTLKRGDNLKYEGQQAFVQSYNASICILTIAYTSDKWIDAIGQTIIVDNLTT